MTSVQQAFLIVGSSILGGVLIGAVVGLLIGWIRGRDEERARCIDIVSGRLCGAHYPKREFHQRLNDPCEWCDRVAECVDYIYIGLQKNSKNNV